MAALVPTVDEGADLGVEVFDRAEGAAVDGLAFDDAEPDRSGLAIRNLVRQLRPLRDATITANGAVQTLPAAIPDQQQALIDALKQAAPRH